MKPSIPPCSYFTQFLLAVVVGFAVIAINMLLD